MGDVISIFKNKASKCSSEYKNRILRMDKQDLLEEMVRFQKERSRVGHLTMEMILEGQVLFKALEESAETPELKILTRSYRKHLDLELQDIKDRENNF